MIYICEKRNSEGRWILRGAARIGEFLREKNRGNGEEQLQPRLSRYASSYSRCFYPYSISPFGFFLKIQCVVDWCGRKGPQFVLLRLVACLFALF